MRIIELEMKFYELDNALRRFTDKIEALMNINHNHNTSVINDDEDKIDLNDSDESGIKIEIENSENREMKFKGIKKKGK